MLRPSLFAVIALTLCIAKTGADKLDEALASAIFPPSSSVCNNAGSSTSFNKTYSSTSAISKWDVYNAQYEQHVFMVDMIHNDNNKNRSWTLRLGKGGQISSLIVAAGEAIANQAVVNSTWNDLVQQMVAVNGVLNTASDPNFIHQAGPYMRDTGMPPPFYSPNVALNCAGNECSTINWGQQAHVPTFHDSPLLYYTRYRDCGNGVIEYDMAMHHFGQISSDIYDYFNTPWTGVRTSTFRDMMISNTSGVLQAQYPLAGWGASTQLRNLDTTGGFTTFAEELPFSSDEYNFGFCVNTTKNVTVESTAAANTACGNGSNPDIVPFNFKVAAGGAQSSSNGLAASYGFNYTVSANFCNLAAPIVLGSVPRGSSSLTLTNNRTGFSFQSKYIIHVCWASTKTYFESSVSAAVINQEFLAGDTITIKYTSLGKRVDDQLAMTFVHGKNPEYPASHYRAKSRIRYGTTNNRRDGTVWTTNFIGTLKPSETYFSRKYMITDRLTNMEQVATPLVSQTFEDVATISELENGQTIKLWMNSTSFGASIGADLCPSSATSSLVCTGSSTPKSGSRPLFYITCGSAKATTSNPYHFAVFEQDDIFLSNQNKKPYLCVGEPTTTRADWKLLGYFGSDCSAVGGREYRSDFCPGITQTPSEGPSMGPSSRPSISSFPSHDPTTRSPTSGPVTSTSIPTAFPVVTPTVHPTSFPTITPTSSKPTALPTGLRTAGPTTVNMTASPIARPTQTPTIAPTGKPTASPTAGPTKTPTSPPTPKPTAPPTARPTKKPTSAPTSKPTSPPTARPTLKPTSSPTSKPTASPTARPTKKPTSSPTSKPTASPTTRPTLKPTSSPTSKPTASPTGRPTKTPTSPPTPKPTTSPTARPTKKPTSSPTARPTKNPTARPTKVPTLSPTVRPNGQRFLRPTKKPTTNPVRK